MADFNSGVVVFIEHKRYWLQNGALDGAVSILCDPLAKHKRFDNEDVVNIAAWRPDDWTKEDEKAFKARGSD